MNLAAILVLCLVTLPIPFDPGAFAHPLANSTTQQSEGGANNPVRQTQSTPSTKPQPASQSDQGGKPAEADSNKEAPKSSAPVKPKISRSKKNIYPNCYNSSASSRPLDRSGNKPVPDGAATVNSSKPCPLPKKVVRNGGSDEPKVELLGGTPAQQASSERSTEEITAATEENLKKLSDHQLTSEQQETINQVKQFIQQSKQAVASGDPERGRNLALKARLLSDELLKP